MKKFLSLTAAVMFLSFASQAQELPQDIRPEVMADHVHDQLGSGMPLPAVRLRAHVNPNPMSERAVVDAGGAVIRHIVISDEEGRVLREHANLNVLRFDVERPGLEVGTHLVDVYTDFGKVTLKMRVQ